MSPMLQRLKERRIFHWGVGYLAAAWVLLQVLDLIGGQFGWPVALMRAITVLLGFGFLLTLVLAWYHGDRGAQRVNGLELAILAVLLVGAASTTALVARRGVAADSRREPTATPSVAPAQGSVAVLPFVNMSGDAENEYFSDGITEEILNVLTKVEGLRVAARTSSFAFKGKNLPIKQIADTLRVAAVLEGSVRKAGGRVRITAQLIDARNGYHLWSNVYDRDIKDVFAVQEEIALAIAEALKFRLTGDAAPQARGTTSNPHAHDLYLQGLFHWNRRVTEIDQAIARFEEATRVDPGYALAYAGLANAYSMVPLYKVVDANATVRLARAAIRRALQIDSMLPEPWATDAHIAFHYDRDIGKARSLMQRALALGPASASTHQWYGEILEVAGEYDAALSEHVQALESDPLSPNVSGSYADALAARDPSRALAQYERTLQLEPDFEPSRLALALLYLRQGKWQEATTHLLRAGDSARVAIVVEGVRNAGRRGAALQTLDGLESSAHLRPIHLAAMALMLNDRERALAILERAAVRKDPIIVFAQVRPEFRPLYGERRFQQLFKK